MAIFLTALRPCPTEWGATITRGYSGQATLPLFVLHRVGFTLPPQLPSERWALTPPFHPYPCGRFLFCGTFRQPNLTRVAPAFTGHAALRCPDFPLRRQAAQRPPEPERREQSTPLHGK